jgi:hypothetical protein
MANPTTNYGWPMPTSGDLVTDLPADFDAFGQPVDNTLKALNPETTLGDISYRSAVSNTNTRLGIGTAGQVLSVSGGVPAWTTTADVTPLTTKGDVFTFSTVDARIGVGADGTVLTADALETTGLKWAALPAAAPASASATVADNEAIASLTYTDLPTAGPAVTITTGTKALVIVTAYLENDGAGQAFMGYAVSGATTIAATDTTALVKYGSGNYRMSAVSRLSSLTAGSNTFTAKYRRTTGATYGYYTNRDICVIDLGS